MCNENKCNANPQHFSDSEQLSIARFFATELAFYVLQSSAWFTYGFCFYMQLTCIEVNWVWRAHESPTGPILNFAHHFCSPRQTHFFRPGAGTMLCSNRCRKTRKTMESSINLCIFQYISHIAGFVWHINRYWKACRLVNHFISEAHTALPSDLDWGLEVIVYICLPWCGCIMLSRSFKRYLIPESWNLHRVTRH